MVHESEFIIVSCQKTEISEAMLTAMEKAGMVMNIIECPNIWHFGLICPKWADFKEWRRDCLKAFNVIEYQDISATY